MQTLTKAESELLAEYISNTFQSALKYELCEFDLDWNAMMMNICTKLRKTSDPEPVASAAPVVDPKKRKYDSGKIKALRDAGWTISAIAGEMKCADQTVRNILKDLENTNDATEMQ